MAKQKRQRERRPQRKQPAGPNANPRSATIARALAQATSAAGRALARAQIGECGSPVLAAKEVFLAYAEAAEQPDPRFSVACRAGCWFCCTIPVAVTVFEAAMVKSAVLSLPDDEQQAIWQRLQEQITKQDQALAHANRQPISFHHRCPLLNDRGQCSVYEGRPLACRSVLSLDAERCRRALLEGDGGDPNVPFSLTNNAAIAGIAQLMVTLNEGQLDHYPNYELASALYALWVAPDRFRSWQQGQLFAEDGFPRMAVDDRIYPTPAGMPIGPP